METPAEFIENPNFDLDRVYNYVFDEYSRLHESESKYISLGDYVFEAYKQYSYLRVSIPDGHKFVADIVDLCKVIFESFEEMIIYRDC